MALSWDSLKATSWMQENLTVIQIHILGIKTMFEIFNVDELLSLALFFPLQIENIFLEGAIA